MIKNCEVSAYFLPFRHRISIIIYNKVPNQTKNGRKSEEGDKTVRDKKRRIIRGIIKYAYAQAIF